MSYTINSLQQDLTGIIHGTTLNKVTNKFPLYNRSAREVLADIDPAETKRIVDIENALYDKVFDYVCPTDLKGDRIIDIRPQVKRRMMDKFDQTYNESFDISKEYLWTGGLTTTQWNTGVKTLRIAKNLRPGQLLSNCDSLTDNGTWAATANAQNLSVDTFNYVEGSGSLKFDLAAGADPSTGYLENSTIGSVDLSTMENEGSIFAYVYIPDPDIITNFIMRWGSSSSNYWSRTVTVSQDSTEFQTGWNLLRFDWNGATETGTGDASDITYLRFTVTYDGTAETNLRLDDIIARLGSIYEIEYYSKFLFRDGTTGAFKENADAITDIINLDTDSYNVYLWKVAQHTAQQIQAQDSSYDVTYFEKQYEKEKARYCAKYRSEVKRPNQVYYRMTTPRRFGNYGNWWGR
jgi:hypothetical protein